MTVPSPREIVDRQGRAYRLRSICPEDAPALQRAFARMDIDDRRTRLFAPTRELSDEAAAQFCNLDEDTEMCLVLEHAAEPGEILGGCRLMGDPDGASAEFSVSLRSDMKGYGLGRVLMETLLKEAPALGFREVWGSILADNGAMVALCRKLGFAVRRDPDDFEVVKAVWRPADATMDGG